MANVDMIIVHQPKRYLYFSLIFCCSVLVTKWSTSGFVAKKQFAIHGPVSKVIDTCYEIRGVVKNQSELNGFTAIDIIQVQVML